MISACVAIDSDAGFGANGTLPWDIPEEFKFYQDHVRGGICIIGSRSFDDLVKMSTNAKGQLYKNCLLRSTTHIVVSSMHSCNYTPEIMNILAPDLKHISLYFVNSVKAAVSVAKSLQSNYQKDIHFIGGRQIYEEGLDYCDVVYTSIIPATYINCDTHFPVEKLTRLFEPALHKTISSATHADIKVLKWSKKT